MLYLVLGIFFFFFRRKTAYELRISDWSSDVCSSDLLRARHAAGTAVRAAGVSAAGVSVSLIFPDSAAVAQHARARFAGPTGRALNHKIGRASCRERVCQYV